MEELKTQVVEGLKLGWGYLSWGASVIKEKANESGLTESVKSMAASANQKAEESGMKAKVRDAASYVSQKAPTKVKETLNNAANYTYESG